MKEKLVCKICQLKFDGYQKLSVHIFSYHKEISREEYYDNFLKVDKSEKFCKQCNSKTAFISIAKGYGIFCSRKCKGIYQSDIKRLGSHSTIKYPFIQNKIKSIYICIKEIRISNRRMFQCRCLLCQSIVYVQPKDFYSGKIKCCINCRYQNLVGKKFGRLTVIESIDIKGQKKWKCQCECGNISIVLTDGLIHNKIKSCGCLKSDLLRSKKIYVSKDIPKFKWNSIKNGAAARDINFLIDVSDAQHQWDLQNGKCALTGILLTMPKYVKDREATASLDRIDNNKEYSSDNIQWVHKNYNRLKNNWNNNDFILMCKTVVSYQNSI